MYFKTGQLVIFDDEFRPPDIGIVIVQYDNLDTEVFFASDGQILVCGESIEYDECLKLLEEL
tara:strand:- start:434 stop:619 length:186 start_codon:yes stop_codon:yes gene_type:complete